MRSRSVALSAVLVISFTTLFIGATGAGAAVKPGSACKKLGASEITGGKKYSCIRSFNKLIWSNGVSLKKATGSRGGDKPFVLPKIESPVNPSPSATPAPVVAEKTIYEKWRDAGSNAYAVYEIWRKNLSSGKPSTPISFWFSPSVPADITQASRSRMENAVLQWERFYSLKRSKVYFDLSTKDEIALRCAQLAPRSVYFPTSWCIPLAEEELARFFYAATSFESEGGWRPILDPNLSSNASVSHSYSLYSNEVFYTDSFFPRIEHEWFHQIQYDLTGNNALREYPVWFTEGSAEYFGLLAAAAKDPDRFIRHRAMLWYPQVNDYSVSYFENWIAENSKPRLSYNSTAQYFPNDQSPYQTGAILTEWLTQKIGITGVIDLMRDTEKLGWTKAFEKNAGKSQESFRSEMAEYLYREFKITDQNRNLVSLPNCKSLASSGYVEANPGVCISSDGMVKR